MPAGRSRVYPCSREASRYGTASGAKSTAAASAEPSEPRRAAEDRARRGQERRGEDDGQEERAVEQVIVRAQPLQEHESRHPDGAPRVAGSEVEEQLRQSERDESVGHDVEPRGFVDLIGVKPVERARGPGRDFVRAEHPREAARPGRRQQAGKGDRDVGGEDRVARRPDDRGHGEGRQEAMVGKGQRAAMRVQDVRVEQVRGSAEGLVDVPRDEVRALQRVADVGHGVPGPQRQRQEAREREHHIEGQADRAGTDANPPRH